MLNRLCPTCRPGGCPTSALAPATFIALAEVLIAQRGYACPGGHLRTTANTVRADGAIGCLDCERVAPPDSIRFPRCAAGHLQTRATVVYTQWGEARCPRCLVAAREAATHRAYVARVVARAVGPC